MLHQSLFQFSLLFSYVPQLHQYLQNIISCKYFFLPLLQVNNAERGFSVLCDGPLDMRMNPQVTAVAPRPLIMNDVSQVFKTGY